MSKFTLGQQFWLLAAKPSKISISVALILGSVLASSLITWTIAFGSSDPDPRKPLGLCYLKLLATNCIPLDTNADANVSPL